MNEFLAIVGDTWRQSRTQVVFIILVVLLALSTAIIIALPRIVTDTDGVERLGLWKSEHPVREFERLWEFHYSMSLAKNAGEEVNPFGETRSRKEVMREQSDFAKIAADEAKKVPPLRRGVEVYLLLAAQWIWRVAMALFIAACAGYFPDFIAAGAVDVVISKPVARWKLFLGKYVGGLVLLGVTMVVVFTAIYVGFGIRLGVWHARIFCAIPAILFAAAVLYAILALIGVVWRSSTLAVVLGYLFYYVIDFIMPILVALVLSEKLQPWPWLETAIKKMPVVFVNFLVLQGAALASTLHMPSVAWQPIATAGAWLFATLGVGLLGFRRKDF